MRRVHQAVGEGETLGLPLAFLEWLRQGPADVVTEEADDEGRRCHRAAPSVSLFGSVCGGLAQLVRNVPVVPTVRA